MAVQIRETRVHNPNWTLGRSKTAKRAKKRSAKKNSRKRSKNPSLLLMGPVNPHGGQKVAKKRKAKSARRNPHRATKNSSTRRARGRRANPSHRTRRRRNPNVLRKGTDILQLGFWVVVGLALTRQIPQLLLGAKNSGIMGYLANIAVAIAASWAAGSIGGDKAALGAGAGGGAYVITRAAQENMNPIGKYLSLQGLGDAMALGEIYNGERAYFPTPMGYDNAGNPIIPQSIRPALPAAPAPTNGMGNYGRRMRRVA